MEPEAAEICTFCADLIRPKEEPSPVRDHHPNMGLIEQSSQTCPICKTLLNGWSLEKLQRRFRDFGEKDYKSIALKLKLREIHRVGSGLSWARVETNFITRAFNFVDYFSVTACHSQSINASQPIWRFATTSVPDKVSVLKSWMHDCELKHQKCKPLVGQMPKRLIDVGSLNGRPPRLVMSMDLHKPDIRYATLSYCWGGASLCTTKENEPLHRQEIPEQLFPPTLQDALTLTRHLNIQFLWIDALCIVQDDHAEWEIEASRMQNIYSGSSITIAATDADNGSVGCFSVNSAPEDESGAFLVVSNIGEDSGTIVRVQPKDLRTFAEDSVLNTRGWVLQEMVLSNRIVHCMRSGLYWECRSECRTETGLVFDRSAMHLGAIPILPDDSRLDMNITWWEWMESYSRRRFTFPEDRIPALSGIVRHYQTATKDVPILGLWERSLHQDLLWMRVTKWVEGVDRTPNLLPGIPSWTWLSCPYEIAFDFWGARRDESEVHQTVQDHVKLIEWAMVWTSEPLASDVKSTRLVLKGPVREIVLSVAPGGKDHNPTYFDGDNEEPDFGKHPFPWRYAGQFDNGPRMSPAQYLCLLLRSRAHKDEALIKETFLILEPCRGENVYRRVGIGNFSGEKPSFDLTVRRTLSLV